MKAIAIGLLVAGACSYVFPGFDGVLFPPAEISPEEGHIVRAMLAKAVS